MEIIKHFEVYINAQKATGTQVAIFGILLLGVGVLLHFSQLNPITQGLRNGFFVISIILFASAAGFIMSQNKLLKTKTETYQSNQLEFKHQEVVRMQQVNKNVPNTILGMCITLIIIILALIFFIHQPFWRGVSFSVLIYFLGLLILESISYLSVKNYLESLLN
uniref:hypothetical protein n=1 Tax=Fulvivirga sp. TaxID=1931237 RepID=UPI004049AC96